MSSSLDSARILRCDERASRELLRQRDDRGVWTGELSTSALSTATAVMALEMVRRAGNVPADQAAFTALIENGIRWLARQQNADGGWGDTTKSVSNISTTMLCHAVLHATRSVSAYPLVTDNAGTYIERAGGVSAVRARYGRDKTFSIPILTHCALAGLVDWRDVSPLPFELACLPADFYKWVRLPVVSYALPALIAIGQVRHHFLKPWNPLIRIVRDAAIDRSLAILERIQPTTGGFLEATPLTSFVTMSLAAMGRADHPVVRRGVEFLIRSVRPDGSWPIDTNLATWVTTLSINALGNGLPDEAVPALRDWLLRQQYQEVHPYTNAAPGAWAWTDLAGGVPDADDTPGAMLAVLQLSGGDPAASSAPIERAATWLLDLQNRDGGWPTFCRGWGALPFDRSGPDLTAHALRALGRVIEQRSGQLISTDSSGRRPIDRQTLRTSRAIQRGLQYLRGAQRTDGAWLPLWFGNQHATNDENPTYGTARVLAAFRDIGEMDDPAAKRGLEWLRRAQNPDGGWGGDRGITSSVEETALAAEVFLSLETNATSVSKTSHNALEWLLTRVEAGTWTESSPIGFYFAKLWYFEKLYPMIYTVAALRRGARLVK